MDITAVFTPVAVELIDNQFPTPIKYLQTENPTYSPETGQTTPNVTEYDINAGILSSGRVEQGGVAEEHEMRLWIHHGARGGCQCCHRRLIVCCIAIGIGRYSRLTRRITAMI